MTKRFLLSASHAAIVIFVLAFLIFISINTNKNTQWSNLEDIKEDSFTEEPKTEDLLLKHELCPRAEGNIFKDEIMIHLNKDKSLPENYIPQDLVEISYSIKTSSSACLKREIAPFLKEMFNDASKEGLSLIVTSAFRHPETQSILYKALIMVKGEKAKNRIAQPLHSEHQLGTTIDLSGKSIGYISASNRFEGTPEDLWLRENAYRYGFVLSYPKNKQSITGYDYEPWHYRFIGIDVAKEIFTKQISVEEYFNTYSI